MPCLSGVVESTKDVLQHWNDYYINNEFGIGIQCDKCKKWRKVEQYKDKQAVPAIWICSMWKIDEFRRGSCRIPSDLKEEDFADAVYSPGDLVLAKMNGYDWWPGMIEDCPDYQDYFLPYTDSEHEYHITFFGNTPSRKWIQVSRIKDFSSYASPISKKKCKGNLLRSIEQAKKAMKMSVKERLMNFSFAVRYKGHWPKINKQEVLLPPQTREMKKSTETRSRLIHNKPQVDKVCSETTDVCKIDRDELEVDTEKKSMNDMEFQPIGSQEEEIETNKDSTNDDSSNVEEEDQFTVKDDEQKVKSLMLDALKIEIIRSFASKRNSIKSTSTHRDNNENSVKSYCQQSSLKGESDQSETIEMGDHSEVSDLTVMSDSDKDNHSNKVLISKENSEKINVVESKNIPVTDENSSVDSIKIFSKDKNGEYISQCEKYFVETLRKVYPLYATSPSTFYDVDTESLLMSDTGSNCSNMCSDLVNDCENVRIILENEQVLTDENKTSVENESVGICENKTFVENVSVDNGENKTFSEIDCVSCENETFSENELIIKDENGASFSDNETVIDDGNESTFSDNEPVDDKNETTVSENEPAFINKTNSDFSDDESVIIVENAATSSENNLEIDQRNDDTYLENYSNCSGNEPISGESIASYSKNDLVNHGNAASYLENKSNISVPFSYASYLHHSTFSGNEPVIYGENGVSFLKNNLVDHANVSSYLQNNTNVPLPYSYASYLPHSTPATFCTQKSESFSTFSDNEPLINYPKADSFSENNLVVDLRKPATYLQINSNVTVHSSYLSHSSSEIPVTCENEQYSGQRKRGKKKGKATKDIIDTKNSKYTPYRRRMNK